MGLLCGRNPEGERVELRSTGNPRPHNKAIKMIWRKVIKFV